MSFIIKKANKQAKKLRIGMTGASGFGKTYSALLLAYGICGDWEKICVVDTERSSASLYADLGDFSTVDLRAPYSPQRYIEALKQVADAGFEVIVVDSTTHEWDGEGGCLNIHSKLGGKFQDWGKVTPLHNQFINAILTSSAHVICTLRTKQEYAMQSIGGKTIVEKFGTKAVTRDGFEYELDICFDVYNAQHYSKLSKDRTSVFKDMDDFIITSEHGKMLTDWANKGAKPIDECLRLIRECEDIATLKNIHKSYSQLHEDIDYITAKDKRKEFLLSQK